MLGFAIGFGGCVTVFALHVILSYLRKVERQISTPRQRPASPAGCAVEAPVTCSTDAMDPRVTKIINEIPQRRMRAHNCGREVVATR